MAAKVNEAMEQMTSSKPVRIVVAAAVAVVFGAVSIFSGGSVALFDGPGRAAAGDYVPFVVWFNFVAGFAYIAAGCGLFLMQRWAAILSVAIAAATVLVSAGLAFHIMQGGAFEMRTVGTLALRILVWTIIAVTALSAIPKDTKIV